jgi:hypothetical protein
MFKFESQTRLFTHPLGFSKFGILDFGYHKVRSFSLCCEEEDEEVRSFSLCCEEEDEEVRSFSLCCEEEDEEVRSFSLCCEEEDEEVRSFSLCCEEEDEEVRSFSLCCEVRQPMFSQLKLKDLTSSPSPPQSNPPPGSAAGTGGHEPAQVSLAIVLQSPNFICE